MKIARILIMWIAFITPIIFLFATTKEDLKPCRFAYSDPTMQDLVDDDGYEFTGKDEHVYWMEGFRRGNTFYDSDTIPQALLIVWAYKDK